MKLVEQERPSHPQAPGKNEDTPAARQPEFKPTAQTPLPPVPSSKLQKELSKGLSALRNDKLKEAQDHLAAAFKLAPKNADVDYARGMLADRLGDSTGAQAWWNQALVLDPTYTMAMLALSHFSIRKGDLDAAEAYLQKAREVDPNAWRPYALLSVVNLGRHSYGNAVGNAEHSLELGKNQANPARLPLAEALIALDNRDLATEVLTAYLQVKPPQDQSALAQRLLKSLQSAPGALVTDSTSSPFPSVPPGAKFHFYELPLMPISFPTWIPANVDDSIPPVEAGISCPAEEVLAGASKNVEKFIKSVDHFTATENLDHELVDNWGLASHREKRKFDYIVEISEISHGHLNVEEYRNGTHDLAQFPDGVATLGLPSFVLLFHPYYREDYEISCEGLGRWRDSPAWQFRFIQRPGRPSLRAYRMGINGLSTSVALKGRAWIDENTYQVVRMESDLVAPLPDIKLASEHQDIEFAPVKFRNLKEPMWLPATANIFFDLRGRKFRRRNTFTDYLLFSVDDRQKISAPKETETSSDTPSTQGDTAKP